MNDAASKTTEELDATIDRDFRAFVRAHAVEMGYGRMAKIVDEEWACADPAGSDEALRWGKVRM